MRLAACVLCMSSVVAVAGCGDNGDPAATIGGSVTGLEGSGLVLRLNGGADLAISADGTFTFATPITSGAEYAVTVASQPSSPTQTCVVANGNGTAEGVAVTNVEVTCMTGVFTIGGTVSGLTGSGLVLENNGTDDLAINADGSFAFATPLASGTSFAVTVANQPASPTQTCTISGGTGTVGAGNVTTVVVDCAVDRFTVGGLVAGLDGTVVLQNNAGDDITIAANGSFAFPTTVASGATYAVTVLTQPSSPSQTCVVTSGTGTVTDADITSVRVDCTTDTFTVGGTVTGLAGTGLVLQNNGGDNLAIAADGSFTFANPVASGEAYAVTVLMQPSSPTQVCSVTNGTGTIGASAVTDVQVTCVTSTFTIGGTVTGLAGAGLVLQNNGGDDLAITANGSFTFATPIASGATYAVTVLTQPGSPTQTCTVSGGSGTVGAGNVTSVSIDCMTDRFSVGGTVSGLAGTVVLQNNGGDDVSLTANGSFAFPTTIASGETFAVTVLTDPASPSQTCTVTNGTGTVTSANITSVTVTCVTNTFTVGGTVSGLSGTGLVLQNNAGDDLAISANGSFTFATRVASGTTYEVTVLAQPTAPSQTCVVGSASGAIGGSNVSDVTVTCTTDTFLVGGTVTGLGGSSVVLQNNGGDDLSVGANGTFSFATRVPSGGTYSATVLTQPTMPSQTCVVTNGSGSVTNADITSIAVTCTFASNVFTSCGQTGATGPSQGQCDVAYPPGHSLNGAVTVTGGYQLWTVPADGVYRIEVLGAQGGNHSFGPGGLGARIRGDFALNKGDELKILVGQKGSDGIYYDVGGGGGSFVAMVDDSPLIVAGGGGGAGNCGMIDASVMAGQATVGNGQGGTSGNDGTWCGCGGEGSGGGGFLGNGGATGGLSFVNGGTGATTERPNQCVDSGIGGFGGGGNGGNGGGGGGGYQGGDAGGPNGAPGKGGLSYNIGVNPLGQSGVRAGHGQVTITHL